MVKIRLKRTGRRNRPAYRIAVQDIHDRRDRPALEILGTYDPLKAEDQVVVNVEKAQDWISKGAQPTEKTAVLLKKAGVTLS